PCVFCISRTLALYSVVSFFLPHPATTVIYPLSLHDALPILLESLPLAAITSTIGIVLVIVFFVTSSDSGSLVIDTITAGGKVDADRKSTRLLQSRENLVCRLLLEKKKNNNKTQTTASVTDTR